MKPQSLIAVALAGLWILGCAKSGDVGAAMFDAFSRYGANALTPKSRQLRVGKWKVHEDSGGTIFTVWEVRSDEMLSWMAQIYGPPTTTYQTPEGSATIWSRKGQGSSIMLVSSADRIEIGCIRPLSSSSR